MCVKHNTHPTARLFTGGVERIACKLLGIRSALLLILLDDMGTRKICGPVHQKSKCLQHEGRLGVDL